MDKFFFITGYAIGIGYSLFLLNVRKYKWCTNKFRFVSTGTLFSIGIFGLILKRQITEEQFIFFLMLMWPLIHSLFDRFFKFLSYKIHDRDIILNIRGSDDLDRNYRNPKTEASDIIFSTLLVILLFLIPLLGI
jgi:hypothetical protein